MFIVSLITTFVNEFQKGAAYGCPKFFSSPENIWFLLRKAKEKERWMRSNFPKSSFLVEFYNSARTYFQQNG